MSQVVMVPDLKPTQFVIWLSTQNEPQINKFETWIDANNFIKRLKKLETLQIGPVEIDDVIVWLFKYTVFNTGFPTE